MTMYAEPKTLLDVCLCQNILLLEDTADQRILQFTWLKSFGK